MKKSLIIALAMVAPVMAGDEKSAPIAEYVDVPTPTQPAVQSAWGIEVAGTYSDYALKYDGIDGFETLGKYDLYGGSLTAVYNFDEKSAFTVRFSYAEGDEQDWGGPDMENYSITAGLRSSTSLTENLSLYLGIEAGYIDTKIGDYGDEGIMIGAEIGLKYNVTQNFYVFGTVGVSGVLYFDKYTEEVYYTDGYNEYYDEDDCNVFGVSVNASIGVGYKF